MSAWETELLRRVQQLELLAQEAQKEIAASENKTGCLCCICAPGINSQRRYFMEAALRESHALKEAIEKLLEERGC